MKDRDPYTPRRSGAGKAVLILFCVLLFCFVAAGAAVLGSSLKGVRLVPRGSRNPVYSVTERAAGYLGGADPAPADGAFSAASIYAAVTPACVGVSTHTTETNVFGQVSRAAITGSGFLISADGYILTNNHVIETAAAEGLEVKVMLFSGEEYTAQIVGGDSTSDVALLKISGSGFPTAALGTFSGTVVGEPIYAIGNPLGELTYTMTGGIVSALDRSIPISNRLTIDMFQIDAAINNGNSGGPVVNRFGQVIGIASAKYSASGVEGLGFAIPIDDALRVVDDLIAWGYVRGRPWLGIVVADASYYVPDAEGARISEVTPGSCAEKAGLQPEDIIVEAEGKEIRSVSDLLAAKKAWKAGDTVTITCLRGGARRSVRVTLDEAKP